MGVLDGCMGVSLPAPKRGDSLQSTHYHIIRVGLKLVACDRRDDLQKS